MTGLPYSIALLLAVGIIILYTYLGGYLAVAYTDFFQSLVMVIGVVWILVSRAGRARWTVGGKPGARRARSDAAFRLGA